jgi:LemA protein
MSRRFTWVLLGFLAVTAVVASNRYIAIRDDLGSRRTAIAEEWTQVEAALQRRADALSMLTDGIGGLPQDSPLIREIEIARAHLKAARGPDRAIRANREVSHAMAKLLLHCDSDSKRRAGAACHRLQDEMAAYEDEIARERFEYNNALEHYNAQMRRFPDNIVALIAGFARNDSYFGTGPELPATATPVR